MHRIDAPFTYVQLSDIERELSRAIATLGRYADADVMAKLRAADYIMAEVRNAGAYLSNPDITESARAEVANRLLEIFANRVV